jgi:DNA-binding MarR family transcriptional regulator
MEAAGWLARQRSSEDERRVHVVLTPTGRALQARAAHVPGCVVAQSGLPLDEVIALNQKIRRLRTAMQVPATTATSFVSTMPSTQPGQPSL